MNRITLLLALCGVFLVTLTAVQPVLAQESLPEDQLRQIRQNCVNIQTTLSQLYKSDKALRVRGGRLYEQISTKLMVPLNVRIVSNRLGGLKLTATTMEYGKQLDTFRASYQQYDDSMTRIVELNCQEHPMDFYNGVKLAREKRQKLHDDTVALKALLQTYKADFEDFAKENSKDSK